MPLFLPESSSTSEEICAKLRGDPLAWDQIQEEELVQEGERPQLLSTTGKAAAKKSFNPL